MTIKFAHSSLDLAVPKVMGILNVTPDSFFDGGKYISVEKITEKAGNMLAEGAAVIDIGGHSTRPGANEVRVKEELKRLIGTIETVRKKFPSAIISADTFRSEAAEKAVAAGADMINDISGGTFDEKMFETIGRLKVPYVLTHIKGTLQNMQDNPHYDDVAAEVMSYFVHRVNLARASGITQLIIDPGFGFGKTVEHNYILLNHIGEFKKTGFPVLAGVSRKSMINRVLGIKPPEALNGTTAVNTIALMKGADMLRVHDVKEAMEAVRIVNFAKTVN